ncbi:hypothetical protein [Nocardia transvalensis]|uniref:hypothetical protein n=1 Tax=Nocardia transvalensis TaxID=37333 RepID=UPI0018936A10|nr:hypothetical protein [Nocardia transvalensis]MBF6327999.1 hypothetical protein [Nocardia transvalensis]
MPATLAELEARVAALEADRADYKAVLAAVNALSEQTRERFDVLDAKMDRFEERLGGRLNGFEVRIDDTNSRLRSLEENVAEMKDLLIRALDQR